MAFSSPGNPPISSGDRTASAHKAWLESLVATIENIQWFLSAELAGLQTGWYSYGSLGYDVAKPLCSDIDMNVQVYAGAGFYDNVPFRSILGNRAFVAPVSNPRIDLIAWDAENGAFVNVAGTEAASPARPTLPINHLEVCEVHHRVGETLIKNADDATNGYIVDTRVFVN